ncbi:MAG: hypothetical protein ACRDS0_31200 [Pseudonocardiaceae bacterium]
MNATGNACGVGGREYRTDAYDRLDPVWAKATDENLWNDCMNGAWFALYCLPTNLASLNVLDADCAGKLMPPG